MTIQVSERLHLRGETHAMRSTPLHAYLHIVKPVVTQAPAHSACWRGYVGEWEIFNNRLYLVAINATVIDKNHQRLARLTDYFPEARGKVFAHWYSGKLILPVGEALVQATNPYHPVFAENRVLTIKAGVLVDEIQSTHQASP